jgi:hypothetical protein
VLAYPATHDDSCLEGIDPNHFPELTYQITRLADNHLTVFAGQ